MIVIIKHGNITYIEYFKRRFVKYWFCIIKWKLKGAEVSTIKESDLK